MALRRSRLGVARNSYNAAAQDYKDWKDGYNQVWNNRRKHAATNIETNNDWIVKQVGTEVRNSKNRLNAARKNLSNETSMARDYYKKRKSGQN